MLVGKFRKLGEDLFAFHFSKQQKFVLELPKWKFSTGKKFRKNDYASSEKFFCYAPAVECVMKNNNWQTHSSQKRGEGEGRGKQHFVVGLTCDCDCDINLFKCQVQNILKNEIHLL